MSVLYTSKIKWKREEMKHYKSLETQMSPTKTAHLNSCIQLVVQAPSKQYLDCTFFMKCTVRTKRIARRSLYLCVCLCALWHRCGSHWTPTGVSPHCAPCLRQWYLFTAVCAKLLGLLALPTPNSLIGERRKNELHKYPLCSMA